MGQLPSAHIELTDPSKLASIHESQLLSAEILLFLGGLDTHELQHCCFSYFSGAHNQSKFTTTTEYQYPK